MREGVIMMTEKTFWVLTTEYEIQNLTRYEDGYVEATGVVCGDDLYSGIIFASEDIFSLITDNTKYIRELKLPEGANVTKLDIKDDNGNPLDIYKTDKAIFECRRHFDEIIIRELIEDYHVNINASDSRILVHYCKKNDIDTVKYLLKVGVRLDYPKIKQQPINYAIVTKNMTLFKLLYKKMKSIKTPSYIRDLMVAIVTNGSVQMLSYLVRHGSMLYVRGEIDHDDFIEFQKTLVKQACIEGRFDMLKYIINDLHIKIDAYYNDSLEYAVLSKTEDIEMIRYLLSKNVNVHSNDDRAFRYAVERNRLMTVQELIHAGADIHVYGNIALITAYKHNYNELYKYLGNLDDINKDIMNNSIEYYTNLAHAL